MSNPGASSGSSASSGANPYWKANLRVVIPLLGVWFLVGYVLTILLIEPLNRVSIGNLGLGFWLAQQGAIFVFVGIVWFYAVWMGRVDKAHAVSSVPAGDSSNETTREENQ